MASNNDKIISSPEFDYTPHPGGLGCAFFEKMQENQDKLAQINGLTGEEETYKSFLKRCIRTAITMRSKGVTPDDFITISSIASMDVCVPYIATLLLGVKPVSLDPNYSTEDLIYMLKQITPKIIFAGLEVVEKMEKAIKELPGDIEIVVLGNTTIHTPFLNFLQSHPEEDDFKPVPAKSVTDTALILFSSGTSGLPKAICLNHYSFLMTSYQTGHIMRLTRVLTFASLHWVSTLNLLVTSVLYSDCRIVVPRFDPSKFWELLETHKPTMLFLAPAFVVALTRFERPETVKALPLKVVVIAGGLLAEKHIKNFQNTIPEATVMLLYAQTELVGALTYFKLNIPQEMTWLKEKPTSIGTISNGLSFKVVDIETQEILGPNQSGELRIKSKVVMNGYSNLDSSDLWDSEGFLKTGDIGYYDEDRCFYIVDRVKEILKFRQSQVFPAVVEAVIMQHPAVEGTIVIGIPHEEDGNHLMALVVLSKAAKEISPTEIQKFVEERVSDAQKLRAGIKIVERIPMTATGKINRKGIRDKVLQGEL